MRQKPWYILALAAVHIFAPIGNLFMNAYWANIFPERYLQLYFQPHNLIPNLPGLLLPIAAGLCILVCRKWSFIVYFGLMTNLCIVDFYAYQERMLEMSPRSLIAILALNVVTMFAILHPRIRSIYLQPNLRWWETKPRFSCELPVQMETSLGMVKGLALNFSESGMLLDSTQSLPNQELVNLVIGEGEKAIKVEGQVVRHHPAGLNEFGIKFHHSRQTKKLAKQMATELRAKDPTTQKKRPSFLDSLTQ